MMTFFVMMSKKRSNINAQYQFLLNIFKFMYKSMIETLVIWGQTSFMYVPSHLTFYQTYSLITLGIVLEDILIRSIQNISVALILISGIAYTIEVVREKRRKNMWYFLNLHSYPQLYIVSWLNCLKQLCGILINLHSYPQLYVVSRLHCLANILLCLYLGCLFLWCLGIDLKNIV